MTSMAEFSTIPRVMKIRTLLFPLFVLSSVFSCSAPGDFGEDMQYAKVRTANPLKGFASWEGDAENDVPHSLEYVPVPFDDVLVSPGECDFSVLEEKLEEAKSRRHQSIVRFVIDEPGAVLHLPDFIDVEKFSYEYEGKTFLSPDYNDENLLGEIESFIEKLAGKYDGDARIANIETGLIGHWGEHHVFYCEGNEDALVTDDTWRRFFSAFSRNFRTTQISSRSPSHPGVSECGNIGFYNDMVCSDDDDDYFREMLSSAENLPSRWRKTMVTGELAPTVQEDFIKRCGEWAVMEKFSGRANEFHVSSLLCAAAFAKKCGAIERERILDASNALGYEFSVVSASFSCSGQNLSITAEIRNDGTAPFYYKWPFEISLVKDGIIGEKFNPGWDVTKIAPGSSVSFSVSRKIPGASGCTVLLSIPNPMENGYPVSFANKNQDKDMNGCLTLFKID